MGRHEGAVDRRTSSPAQGTAAVVITGCSTSHGLNGPNAEPARSSTPSHVPTTANSEPADHIRSTEVAASRPASRPAPRDHQAGDRAGGQGHQLRDWRSGDSQYNRHNLIRPPTYLVSLTRLRVMAGPRSVPPTTYATSELAQRWQQAGHADLDDGSASQAQEGLTQLAKRGMTGTFFVMTVVLGKPRWMSIRDIHRLADAGMTITPWPATTTLSATYPAVPESSA